MAKYARFDPRNRKYGRHKNQSLKKDIRIRDADDTKEIHKYKGTQINWVVVDEVEEESAQVS